MTESSDSAAWLPDEVPDDDGPSERLPWKGLFNRKGKVRPPYNPKLEAFWYRRRELFSKFEKACLVEMCMHLQICVYLPQEQPERWREVSKLPRRLDHAQLSRFRCLVCRYRAWSSACAGWAILPTSRSELSGR